MRSCIIVALALSAGVAAAQTTRPTSRPATRPADPEAPGFDEAGSDRVAIVVADAVMKAMGGRHAWDRTRYLTWDFFGHRRHLWDKHAGRVRIEGRGPRTGTPYVMLIDLDTGEVLSVPQRVKDTKSEQAINRWFEESGADVFGELGDRVRGLGHVMISVPVPNEDWRRSAAEVADMVRTGEPARILSGKERVPATFASRNTVGAPGLLEKLVIVADETPLIRSIAARISAT